MDRIEDMIGPTPELERLVKAGKVQVQATVYLNAPNGMEVFLSDMSAAGAGPLVEGKHYLVNGAITDWLRAYTGEVWLLEWDMATLREVAPMLIERDSHPNVFDGGSIHCYNNPLFRLAVKLGAWKYSRGSFRPRPAVATHSPELETELAEARARLAIRSPRMETEMAEERMLKLLVKTERFRQDLEREAFLASGLRKAGFPMSARDHAAKASALRQRLRVAEVEMANHRVAMSALAAALARQASSPTPG
jgi:hypothetical protein